MVRVEKSKNYFLIAIIVACFSQIYLSFFQLDFRVSAGIIAYSVSMYYFEDIRPIPMGIISSIFIYLSRIFADALFNGNLLLHNISFEIEILFYLSYAIFYHIFIYKKNNKDLNYIFVILTLADFVSNNLELIVRGYIYSTKFNLGMLSTVFLVAVLRSLIVWVVLYFLKQYKLLLIKEEHEKRYRKLLWIMSQLKTETYWMEKNMENIENLMVDSYRLYEMISSNEKREIWEEFSLNISRNIHEIKKENALAIRGILEVTERELENEEMKLSELTTILYQTLIKEANRIGKDINIFVEIEDDFSTKKHYYLMSVLRNLIVNSIEAIPKDSRGEIHLSHRRHDDKDVFIVKDNGIGIKASEINEIFNPGYSTKINYETGEISRGLGLAIVKKIVEEELKGEIHVNSDIQYGTEISIAIKRKELEV